jgi:hypothetical protein
VDNTHIPSEKKKIIGKSWAYGFIRRSKLLKFERPKLLEQARILSDSWVKIIPFYEKFNFLNNVRKYYPRLVINFDEISLSATSSKNQFRVSINEKAVYVSSMPLFQNKYSLFFAVASEREYKLQAH